MTPPVSPHPPRYLFPIDGAGDVVEAAGGGFAARWSERSMLAGNAAPSAVKTVMWSGSMAERDEPERAEARFEPSPRNWSAAGWDALDAAVKRWVEAGLEGSLLVRTHAAHIVSDVPSAMRFVRTWADHGVRLVYDIASMITPELAASAGLPDVCARRVDALVHAELARGVAFVLVSNLRVDGGVVRPTRIDDGLLDPVLVRATIAICNDLGIATAVPVADAATGLRPRDAAPPSAPPLGPPLRPTTPREKQ